MKLFVLGHCAHTFAKLSLYDAVAVVWAEIAIFIRIIFKVMHVWVNWVKLEYQLGIKQLHSIVSQIS